METCTALVLLVLLGAAQGQSIYEVTGDWGDRFQANVYIPVAQAVNGGWTATLKFDKAVDLEIWLAEVTDIREGDTVFDLKDMGWNGHLPAGTFELSFIANTQGAAANLVGLWFNGQEVTSGGSGTGTGTGTTHHPSTSHTHPTSPTAATQGSATTVGVVPPVVGAYDYVDALHKSILFYEAQRAGNLPGNNRIPWRRSCCQGDGQDVGLDLSGGWFDAGDHLKLHFPLAYTITVLSWGMIEFKRAYEAAGEMANALDSIKWVTDYLIKCHPSKFEFVAQVGDTGADHAVWCQPQAMTMHRPAKKVTANQPGSEVTAEAAAAMAAASIVFRENGDAGYADTLLQHARDLYEFADTYRGDYQNVIHDTPYPSFGGMNDELTWGAAWMYRATGEAGYLTKAEQYYDEYGISGGGFSWDEKQSGAMLVLYKATNKEKYKNDISTYMSRKMPGGGDTYTPKGLLWLNEWGSCRHSANHAFLALVAASMGINTGQYREFAANQIHYMLGDSGRSLVVGFGHNFPVRPHHRASTCPIDGWCDWNTYNNWDFNENVLDGALVGGPDAHDNYVDDRSNFHTNEVAVDYNAGFQGCLAGLIQLTL
ncbi:endoglucanase E-4-like [Branchiostoma floridae x Branchiostoma belcheri]